MSTPNHIIIYSHGFGVRKDDRGFFASIAAALPDIEHILFNLLPPFTFCNNSNIVGINE